MSLAETAVKKRTVTTFTTAILVLAGLLSFFTLGQLEDPEFTVKTAAVITMYPGATAEEVELEVTDRLEIAVQEMPQLKEIESFSRAGMSLIKVYIEPKYKSAELPQIWDELRKKIRDASADLPPGAGAPAVGDDYGDVYGFFLAVVGDGFTMAELEKYVDSVKKELSLITGLARVELWGNQSECIYLEASEDRLSSLGLVMEDIARTLTQQNVVVDSGGIDILDERLRIETTGEFRSPEEIADLVIRGQEMGGSDDRRLMRIRDVGEVRRGFVEPPMWSMRYNGMPAIGVAGSVTAGGNVVDIGRAVDARLDEMVADFPIGIEIHRISWQSDLVDESINAFVINLIEAVVIVLVVLWLVMGMRMALTVGLCGLVFTILGTFVFMAILEIDLQRMSLGALVIAMGMMVDNAIVVADGISVRMQQGMNRVKAAVEAGTQPSIPLLAATVIAVMAFYPIVASNESAGEYCATLFFVVGISLMVSWVLAVTITPVVCIAVLPQPKDDQGDPYAGRLYQMCRGFVTSAIRIRWLVLLVMLAALVVSGYLFQLVPRMFFPASARAQFMVDYWAPEGVRIQQVSNDIRVLEEFFMDDERTSSVSTFLGQGPSRFYLPVDPESPYQSYGQLIVNVHDYKNVDAMLDELLEFAGNHIPQAQVVGRKYGLGPSETWPVQVRFSGPAIANPKTLRALAEEATRIIEQSPQAQTVTTNWRQRVKKLVAEYDETNARWTSISRADIADATRRAYDGLHVGLYREQDKMLPIILRHTQSQRRAAASNIEQLQVRPPLSNITIPLSQVTRSIRVGSEDPMIWRWDRRRAITVQAVPTNLATVLRADIIEAIESIQLPPGYTMEWDGEYRSSTDAQQSLIPGIIPAVVIVALIIVGLFNAYRPPLIIVGIIPFALIGVTIGLLATGQPFGFVALLGAMSLAGMMVKNAIVLLDQINIELAAGKSQYDAVVDSAVSRVRPVMLAAGTTVLGVMPLLQDVFWISMAVTIMFGLTVGSILTIVGIPVLYSIFFRIPNPKKG